MRCFIAFYHESTIQNINVVSIIISTVFHLDFSVVAGLTAAALFFKAGIVLGVTTQGLESFGQGSQKKPYIRNYFFIGRELEKWTLSSSKFFKFILSVW